MNSTTALNGHAKPDFDILQSSCAISSVLERIQSEEPWSEINEQVCNCAMPLMEKVLTLPYRYLQSKPGKNIRAQIIANFNIWLQIPDRALKIITDVIEMLHTGSLLYFPIVCAYE